jgi:hypothetical protein
VSAAYQPGRRPDRRRGARWLAGASGVTAAALLAAGCTGGSGSSAAGSSGTTTPPGTSATPSSPPATPPPSLTPTDTGGTSPGPTQTRPGSPGVYRLGPGDSGKQVALKVGDRLEITLAGNRLTARWTLTGYPRDALRVELREATFGRFVFVARAAGAGNITFVRAICGRPPDRPCIDRPIPIDSTPTAAPPGATRVFTVPVRVS